MSLRRLISLGKDKEEKEGGREGGREGRDGGTEGGEGGREGRREGGKDIIVCQILSII